MNKILNWTFGACFRTLGRFLAIFIVGVILIFIGSKIGIDLPSWLALNVKADSIYDWSQSLPTLYRVDFSSCTSSSCNNRDISGEINIFETGIGSREFIINTEEQPLTIGQNGYVINIPQPNVKPGYLYQTNLYLCSNKNLVNTTYKSFFGAHHQRNSTNLYNNDVVIGITNYPGLEDSISFDSCHLFTGLMVPDSSTNWFNFRISSGSSGTLSNSYLAVISYEVKELGIYSGTIENTIQNSGFATSESVDQVQDSVNQVQQEIQQTQDTITDESTQGAEDSASGFFNDFTTETFGLTSIITAPLNAINSLISNSCTSLVLPLPFVDSNISLPCMTTIYSQYFGGFFSLYQIITTGLISYYVIVRIFNLVKDFKNPEHDEIEVVDL